MKHWPSILIITISALLMQWHSVAFWLEYTGYTGVGFSLALEVVALWLWWKRQTMLAVVASALLVGGPLFQLSAPVMETLTRNNTNQVLVSSYENEIKQLTHSLIQYDSNSNKRIGWSSRIDRAQQDLSDARTKLRGLLSVKSSETSTRLYLIVLMQALALLIIMRSQIIAVKELPFITENGSKQPKDSKQKTIKESQPVTKVVRKDGQLKRVPVLNDFDKRVIAVAEKMKKQLPSYNGKQRRLADDVKVRPADISMAFRHEEKKESGKEIVSESALIRMEQAMERV